jgi:translation elongation factor EF-Tu-like GTPase
MNFVQIGIPSLVCFINKVAAIDNEDVLDKIEADLRGELEKL